MDTVITQLFQVFAPEGVWAVLSLALIFYILKRQEKRDERQDAQNEKRDARQDARDKKYLDAITKLTISMDDLDEIKKILIEKLR